LLQVDGGADVGKSRLIDTVCARFGQDKKLKVAIAGTAAHNIEGQAIAYAFQMLHKQFRNMAPHKLERHSNA
jgi:hypothetical protein